MKNNTVTSMSRSNTIVKTHFWIFKKEKSNWALLFIFLLAGLYGLYQGYIFKEKQITTIHTFRDEKIANLNKIIKGFDADTTKPEGKEAYTKATSVFSSNWHSILPAYKLPVTTSLFVIGQGDVFPYYYTVKLESFFMQLFKQGEISNPLRSLSGHFDMSFWIIFLLPLLIILLCFNTLSAELENGNWKLIHSQGVTPKQWIVGKYFLVFAFVETLLILLIFSGILINYLFFRQLPTICDFLFLVGATLYLLFWFSILYYINSLGRDTGYNALFAGIIWTMACIIMPSLTTMIIEKTISVDNTKVSKMSRRPQGSKFENDAFGMKTIDQYVSTRPQYKNHNLNPKSPAFSLAVYLTYHEMLDDTNTIEVSNYFKAIERRQQFTNISILINPSASLYGNFNRLAENDAFANHQFIWQTKRFHSKFHNAFFPALFFDDTLSKKHYENFPVFELKNSYTFYFPLFLNYLGLAVVSLLLYFTGSKKLMLYNHRI